MSEAETALQPDLPAEPAGHLVETGPPVPEAGGILTIDFAAIAANWQELGRRAMPSECAAVIKADGYGCGIEPVAARAGKVAGCKTFFVADLSRGAACPRCCARRGNLCAQRSAARHRRGFRRSHVRAR